MISHYGVRLQDLLICKILCTTYEGTVLLELLLLPACQDKGSRVGIRIGSLKRWEYWGYLVRYNIKNRRGGEPSTSPNCYLFGKITNQYGIQYTSYFIYGVLRYSVLYSLRSNKVGEPDQRIRQVNDTLTKKISGPVAFTPYENQEPDEHIKFNHKLNILIQRAAGGAGGRKKVITAKSLPKKRNKIDGLCS